MTVWLATLDERSEVGCVGRSPRLREPWRCLVDGDVVHLGAWVLAGHGRSLTSWLVEQGADLPGNHVRPGQQQVVVAFDDTSVDG